MYQQTPMSSPHRLTAVSAVSTAPTILLVEDEHAVRTIVRTVLVRQGYAVVEAATATAALEIFEERGPEIDLVLTDVLMPGMDGPSLARSLMAMRPALRILFMSGYTDSGLTSELAHPNIGFVSKPFEAATLTSRVRMMLDSTP
jgi:two-component system, cell cycle sensor histidine kinase and response regulator CckA